MWEVVPGIALSLLPRRWRAAIPEETVPWVPAAILSGMPEAILAVGGLTAFVIWSLHPLTWLLASADCFCGKVTRRLRERGVADLPGGKEQLPSFLETARFAVKTVGLESFPMSSRNRSLAPSPSWKFDPRAKRPCGCRRASFASTTSTIALNRCAKAGVRGRLFIACGVLPPASRGGT